MNFLIYSRVGIFLALVLPFLTIQGATSPFFLSKSRLGLSSFYYSENPSFVGSVESNQILVESGSEYLGYVPYAFSAVVPFADWTLGIGFLGLESHDAIRVADTEDRPVSEGTFGHGFRQARVVVSRPLKEDVLFGIVGSWESQYLDTAIGTAWTADIGMTWFYEYGFVGLYSTHLLSTGYQWNDGEIEPFLPEVTVEINGKWDALSLGGVMGTVTRKIYGSYQPHSLLTVMGHGLFDDSGVMASYGYGVNLDWRQWGFFIAQTHAIEQNLGLTQHVFGVRYIF